MKKRMLLSALLGGVFILSSLGASASKSIFGDIERNGTGVWYCVSAANPCPILEIRSQGRTVIVIPSLR